MREDFLIIGLLRNNSPYIEYLNKMFKEVEKNNPESNFEYFFYTNNNEDETIKSLEKYNYKYIDDKEIKYKNQRIKRLAYLRQKLLDSIKDTEASYVVLMDSDIMFNNRMFTEAVKTAKEKNFKVTCLNTLRYPLPWFYDWGAYKKWRFSECWKLVIKTLISNDVVQTDTFFNGMMILKNDQDFKKYNYKFEEGDSFNCEHEILYKTIKEAGQKINIIPNITPIYTEGVWAEDRLDYESYYKIVKNNKKDLRTGLILWILALVFSVFLAIYFIYRYFKR